MISRIATGRKVATQYTPHRCTSSLVLQSNTTQEKQQRHFSSFKKLAQSFPPTSSTSSISSISESKILKPSDMQSTPIFPPSMSHFAATNDHPNPSTSSPTNISANTSIRMSLANYFSDERAMDAISNMNTPFYSAQFSRNLLTSASLNTCYADPNSMRRKLVLDGSLSMELNPYCNTSHRGEPRPTIHALLHDPESIRQVHLKYLAAGADVITTANFSCVPHFLREVDYGISTASKNLGDKSSDLASLSSHLVKLSGEIALSAKNEAIAKNMVDASSVLVAGCIPPVYDSSVLYKKYEIMSEAEQSKLIHSIVEDLNPYVDLFLCESLVCIQQAELAAGIAMATGKPVWISWQLNDTPYTVPLLFSCETLAQGVDRLLNSLPRFVDAYLFNCSSPTIISASLPLLRRITRRPIGAYARLPPKVHNEVAPFAKHPSSFAVKSKDEEQKQQSFGDVCDRCEVKEKDASPDILMDQHIQQKAVVNLSGQPLDPYFDPVTGKVTLPVGATGPGYAPHPSSSPGSVENICTNYDTGDLRTDYTQTHFPENVVEGKFNRIACDPNSGFGTQSGNGFTSYSKNETVPNSTETSTLHSLPDLVRELNATQSPEAYANLAAYWVQCFGADIVGGCCGVGVEHIRQVAIQLKNINDMQERRMKAKMHKRS